jgi:hypothetical protein
LDESEFEFGAAAVEIADVIDEIADLLGGLIGVGVKDQLAGVVAQGKTGDRGFAAEKAQAENVAIVSDRSRQGGDTQDDAVDAAEHEAVIMT